MKALLWWQHLPLAEGRRIEISLSYSARAPIHIWWQRCLAVVQLLRSLELEIAVPRKPLKPFTFGGSCAAVEISGIKDSNTQEAINATDV